MNAHRLFAYRPSLVLTSIVMMAPIPALAHSASRVAALPVVVAVFGVIGLVCFGLSLFSVILWRRSLRGASSPWLKRMAILDCIVSLQIFGVWLLVGARFSGGHVVLLCTALAMATLGVICFRQAQRSQTPL